MIDLGEARECYVRLNNIEASNHGYPARARFRAFLSKEAFDKRAHFVWETVIEFTSDVSKPLWKQAYEAFKAELAGDGVKAVSDV